VKLTTDKAVNAQTLVRELKSAGITAAVQSDPSGAVIVSDAADEASVQAVVHAHTHSAPSLGSKPRHVKV